MMGKVIDFAARKVVRDKEKLYEYIGSMVRINQPELFDKLIAEQVLTDEKTASCSDFLKGLQKSGRDPLIVLQEATCMYGNEEDYYEDNGINWNVAIEHALVYYAVLREHDHVNYQAALLLHPYISAFDL